MLKDGEIHSSDSDFIEEGKGLCLVVMFLDYGSEFQRTKYNEYQEKQGTDDIFFRQM